VDLEVEHEGTDELKVAAGQKLPPRSTHVHHVLVLDIGDLDRERSGEADRPRALVLDALSVLELHVLQPPRIHYQSALTPQPGQPPPGALPSGRFLHLDDSLPHLRGEQFLVTKS